MPQNPSTTNQFEKFPERLLNGATGFIPGNISKIILVIRLANILGLLQCTFNGQSNVGTSGVLTNAVVLFSNTTGCT
jgi:hypothetical protein